MKRAVLIAASASLLIGGAEAEEKKQVSTGEIYACASIVGDAERLACYDETVSRFEAAEKAGEVTTISKSEVEELAQDSFGFSVPSLPRIVMPKFGGDQGGLPDEVELAVASVERTRYQKLRVTLENGQVWEQTDGKRIQYSQRIGVDSAVVKRAALGSYKMKLDGGPAFRVARLK